MNLFGYHLDFGPWQVFALLGNLAFTSRFLVQWIQSERAKKSIIPISFWWLSIVGSLILLAYFIRVHEPIGILSNLVNVVPYARNLVLIYRHEKAA